MKKETVFLFLLFQFFFRNDEEDEQKNFEIFIKNEKFMIQRAGRSFN
jgi:hypothetical protein